MAKSSSETYSVLLADDSENDRFLLRRALHNHPKLKIVGEVWDGTEVIAYLSGKRGFANRKIYPFPDLLILDLKMPFKTGFEVLRWLQTQAYKKLLVVVLSCSSLPEDYDQSLALGAHAYYVKVPTSEAQEKMIGSIETLLDISHSRGPKRIRQRLA